jgi:hypothetical protein
MMKLSPSKLNEVLAASVKSKAAAEVFAIAGRSGFWRAIGVGMIGLGIGSATGLLFFGYSFVVGNASNQDMLTTAVSKALSDIQLHGTADGTVTFEPHEVSLSAGQTVSLDPTSRLRLDPSAKVTADGEIKIQMPTITIPQASIPRPKGGTPVISNFTIFKTVPFANGTVQTGWKFLTSAQRSPTTQYCYYQEKGENPDVAVRAEVGVDEKILQSKSLSKSFDLAAAFEKCVWFKKEGL